MPRVDPLLPLRRYETQEIESMSGLSGHEDWCKASEVAELEARVERLTADRTAPHWCSGCGLRWDVPLGGAELCGDCWRKAQPILHARAQPAAHAAWQPIDTAPKDVAILLWTGWSYQLGHFNTMLKRWAAGWDHRPIEATHWMPLPAPPVPASPAPPDEGSAKVEKMKDDEAFARGGTKGSQESSRTASQDAGSQGDRAETTCRRCGERIRWIDGAWTDCETHTHCDRPDLDVADVPKHVPPDPMEEANLDGDVLSALTAIVREADQTFQRVGGSSRHWVRDCFWPLLDREGWLMVPKATVTTLQAERDTEQEKHALRLAACDVASLSNTRDTYANAEIAIDNPAWTPAYGSVRATVAREMDYRERLEVAESQLQALRAGMKRLVRVVNQQAEDDGLWFIADSVVEAYFQQELRKLHEAVETEARSLLAQTEET